jgi:MFS family permease
MMNEYDQGADTHNHDDWSEPPKWPKVVGIITTILASLGLVCGGLGAASTAGQVASQGGSYYMITLAMQVVGLVVAIIGIFAGVTTILRKKQGRMLHLVWASATLVLFVVSMAMLPEAMKQANAQISQGVASGEIPPEAEETARTIGLVMMIVFVSIGAVLSGLWPLFCIVWFGAKKKRPEVGAPEVL